MYLVMQTEHSAIIFGVWKYHMQISYEDESM